MSLVFESPNNVQFPLPTFPVTSLSDSHSPHLLTDNLVSLPLNLSQILTDNHGPLTIEVKLFGQKIIATIDNGAKASIVSNQLVKGLPTIPNTYFRLMDFGQNSINDYGIVILPLQLGDKELKYPFFVVKDPPCPLLLGHDFQESYLTITDEVQRSFSSFHFGTIPFSSKPQKLFQNIQEEQIQTALNNIQPVLDIDLCLGQSQLASDFTPLPPGPNLVNISPSSQLSVAKIDIGALKINPNLTATTKDAIIRLIMDFKHIFSWDPTHLGRTNRIEFEIDTGDHSPLRQQQFPHPQKIHDEIQIHVQKLLNQGLIIPYEGPWSSPCFFVPKKDDDGNLTAKRFTIDYRALNCITKKMQWPISRIEDIFQSLQGNKYFTILDFASGYYQIPMSQSAQEKAAFITREGTFAPTVLPFGVSNGPGYFARLLEQVLHGLKGTICQNYFDDLITAASTEDEALDKLKILFQRLSDENLTLKPYKCEFLQNSIRMLGFVISEHGTTIDDTKLTGVSKLKPPNTGHQAKQMVGFFSYFRKYIENFTRIIDPIKQLSQIQGKIKWQAEHQVALDSLKGILLSEPVLALFDPNRETVLRTDASILGLSGSLFQIYDGNERPVAFISRTLKSAEKNYHPSVLELTAICWALCRLRNLIYGMPITIRTDCHGICYFLHAQRKKLNPRLSRLAIDLTDYNITEIRHVNGKHHQCADFLSRFPTEEYDPAKDELKDLPLLTIGTINLQTSQSEDQKLAHILRCLEDGTNKRLTINFEQRNGVLYYRNVALNRLVLVIPSHLIPSVLEECHDCPFSGGHLGPSKTYQKVRQRYWFPKMRRLTMAYTKTCRSCQNRKIPRHRPYGLMQLIPVPKGAFQRIQIDISGPYPRSSRQNAYIITACCYLTKWLETRAIKAATTETVIKFLVEQIICRHGVPTIIQSDQGSIFTADLFQKLSQSLGIKQCLSTAFHQQSQGQIEHDIEHGPCCAT